MAHLMAIRPLTKKAMDTIGENGFCLSDDTNDYALGIMKLKKLGLHGNGNVVGIGCTDGKSCGWTNEDFIAYEQRLIDEGLDTDGHSQRTIEKLRKAMAS
tara:strand:- start:15040 stop:15339 length:300 start_codon:yes stop_codon:yes gene_type:complete